MDFIDLLSQHWQQQSVGELFAVAFAIAYVWLAAQESIWCWPAGFISTSLYVYIYWDVTLFFQMLLNGYYMGMAVWGFLHWGKKGDDKVVISRMNVSEHAITVVSGIIVTGVVYFIAVQFLNYDLVLLDISLTVFSLITTYLTVIKKLENWVYWSVINAVSIILLYDRALYPTMLLMLVYLALAMRAVLLWHRIYSEANDCAETG